MKRLFKQEPPPAPAQQIDAEREQRVTARDRVSYSYSVFWMKNARLWDKPRREAVTQHLAALLNSPDFDANFYQRTCTVEGVDGAHSGASLLALQQVLQALSDE